MRWPEREPYEGAYHDLWPSWEAFWSHPPTDDEPYTITMQAVSSDGDVTCEGSEDFDVEVLIVDDASADGTAAYARRALERSDLPYPSSVLANPRNQGYGGNQKMGYQYAIAERFDGAGADWPGLT